MQLILAIFLVLPQNYINLLMAGNYDEALKYCQTKIEKNRDVMKWTLEMGDIYYNNLFDLDKAQEKYQEVIDKYQKKLNGWHYLRLAQVLELKEDYLEAAKIYEVVATKYRKAPLDSFALSGVERCFKKNYQEYVASIDDHKITRLELDDRLGKGARFMKRDEKAILDQMVTELLIHINAIKNNIQSTEFFKNTLKDRKRRLMLEEVRACEVDAKAEPREIEVKRYYYKHRKNYKLKEEIRGKEIIVESDSLAQFLLDSLKKDINSFDTLAKLYSTAGSKRTGGNMGVVYKGTKPKPVEKALFKTKPNHLTGIVKFDGKFGIYLVTSHKPARYRKFEELKTQLKASVKAEKAKKLEEKFTKRLWRRARIHIYKDSIKTAINDSTPELNRVIATVNGRKITWQEIKERNESQPHFGRAKLSDEKEIEKLLKTMIEEELKLEYGLRKKYFLHDGFFARLKDVVNRLLDQGLYQKVVVDAVQIDTQEIRDYYDNHKDEFKIPESVRCQEIVVKSKELARNLRKILLADPTKFDSLAKEHSIARTAKRGGDTGVFKKKVKPPKYDKIAFSLQPGQISKIFSTDDTTFTIIKVNEHKPMSYRKYEEVKESLRTRLLRKKQSELAQNYLKKIREEADIKIFLKEEEKKEEKKEIKSEVKKTEPKK